MGVTGAQGPQGEVGPQGAAGQDASHFRIADSDGQVIATHIYRDFVGTNELGWAGWLFSNTGINQIVKFKSHDAERNIPWVVNDFLFYWDSSCSSQAHRATPWAGIDYSTQTLFRGDGSIVLAKVIPGCGYTCGIPSYFCGGNTYRIDATTGQCVSAGQFAGGNCGEAPPYEILEVVPTNRNLKLEH
jgi:hypothetical protein